MEGILSPSRLLTYAAASLFVLLQTGSDVALAQVSVQQESGEIILRNNGFNAQRLARGAGKTQSSVWTITDEAGNTYEASTCSSVCNTNSEGTVTCGGYDAASGADPAVVRGYRSVLRYLADRHGAVIVHDSDLGADLISFPEVEDQISYFFEVITTETLDGRLLIDYFRFVELNAKGTFDPAQAAAKPGLKQFAFPNDDFYSRQWNLRWSRLAQAQWHPARARRSVRIGVIDSGIGNADRGHPGLDGTEVVHRPVAPTSGFPSPHALGIVTLLGDRAQDDDGVIGLLGDRWDAYGGYQNPPLLARRQPTIFSYNVGDFGPTTIQVARAIRQSIRDRVDVINLSMGIAPSPIVEEAIQEALRRRIIVVAAAGNYAPEAAYKPAKFPASIDGVISVGAGTRQRTFSAFSANEGVDILAPGERLIVGSLGGTWYEAEGTSFAAPHVVAALAMMLAVDPNLRPDEALQALQRYAQASHRNGGVGFLSALSSLNSVLHPRERVRPTDIPLPHFFSGRFDAEEEEGEDDEAGKVIADDYDPSVDASLFETEAFAAELPQQLSLVGNYPNPFNPSTVVRFALPEGQHVRLAVFNLLGQQVGVLADGYHEAGIHDVRFDAAELASGVYLARLETARETSHLNMVLMK